jgi:nucleoid DNA-binding protein
MTKRDIVVRISEESGMQQQKVLEIVQKTLDYIAEALARGKKVELRNFGVFEVKVRKARIGRNPNAPETDVPLPRRAVVKCVNSSCASRPKTAIPFRRSRRWLHRCLDLVNQILPGARFLGGRPFSLSHATSARIPRFLS